MLKEIINKQEVKTKVISLATKIKILDHLRNGERVIDVASIMLYNLATIRTIRKNENSIRKSVAAGTSTSTSTTSYVRDIAMENMEKALMIWIEDQTQKRMPIDANAVTNKALRIYEKIKEQLPSSSLSEKQTFTASHGELTFGDVNAVQEYPTKFAESVANNSYTPDQVFNADESGLFWKKMPERTYVSKIPKSASGHEAAKDRITILFYSNTSGDYIMKPLVINKSKMPRIFKGININHLPVYWRANKKAWVTATMFNEWFHECYIPDAKKYLNKKGLPFKVLLLIDNTPGHPQDLQHENVQALYIKRAFTHILEQMENNESLTVINAWKNFTILDCVKHIALSYTAIKQSMLNGCWKKLWPNIVKDETSISPLKGEYSQIVQLVHSLGGEGFDDFTEGDIAELVADKELSEDDLINMVDESSDCDNDPNEEEFESVVFTAKVICEELKLGKKIG
ncbi:tigger transposable element-derived protein 1-like [Centruroides vittatus]|uniref:tigger transposable element-derived protein 1-like n=1 Tax=Centruroides vittatus TaxID=120091 RepID=UPI00350F07CF